MAKETITGGNGTSGQTGLSVRTMINDMFTELYSKFHTRKHSLTSMDDHSTVFIGDRGKYCKSDGPTGNVIWGDIKETELPVEIARQSALTGHTGNKGNPHEVTAAQLGITTLDYQPGLGLTRNGSGDIKTFHVKIANFSGLDCPIGGLTIDTGNTAGARTPAPSDVFLFKSYSDGKMALIALSDLKTLVANPGSNTHQVIATSGKEVSVKETGSHITASWTAANTLTVTFAYDNPELYSININLTGYSTLKVIIQYVTAGPEPQIYPVMQAWRNDTKAQLVGAVINGDAVEGTFNISGLINSTLNRITLKF